ncbi:hypothetical protein BOX15_Mlig005143g2 [Macrostomum lignano]|uniref:Uncharacterized protein n=1 Tax=Macrostomum lignano TaxID=282301 RepID=A0A267F339_9PLAT|nr:hypothetical protein BOX15_Mlig005143g2 [Macrostomum lignano]
MAAAVAETALVPTVATQQQPPAEDTQPKDDSNLYSSRLPRMTKEELKRICKELKLYLTPHLNDILYLHYKGYARIENLEEYTGLRCLFLECNGIRKLENLDAQTEMRCLYMAKNLVERIENLDSMVNLDTIDLSHNSLERIENLSNLTKLTKVILAHNKISSIEDLKGLLDCPSLTVVDLQHNKIEDAQVIDEIFVKMPNLRVLYLQGNPVVKQIKFYRKTLTHKLPNLTYLDDRPVFPNDRRYAEAYFSGGAEAERAERKLVQEEEQQKTMASVEWLLRKRQKNEVATAQAKAEAAAVSRGEDPASVPPVDPAKCDWLYGDHVTSDTNSDGFVDVIEADPPTGDAGDAVDNLPMIAPRQNDGGGIFSSVAKDAEEPAADSSILLLGNSQPSEDRDAAAPAVKKSPLIVELDDIQPTVDEQISTTKEPAAAPVESSSTLSMTEIRDALEVAATAATEAAKSQLDDELD